MRGNLTQRGKESWRARVYLGLDDAGRRRYASKTIRGTKREAEEALNQLLVEAAEHRRHPMAAMGGQTFAELVAKWREIGASDLEKSTLFEYERLLERRLLPRFGSKKLRSIRTVDLDTYYAELHRGDWGVKPLGALSIQHVHAVLRMLLNQAVRWEWIPTNPASKASPPRVPKSQRTIPSPQAVRRILEDCEHHDPELACFLRLSAVSGARRGEVCALRWSDVDLESGSLIIQRSLYTGPKGQLLEKGTKTHASRRVSLDPATRQSLARHRGTCEQRAKACDVELAIAGFVFSDTPDGAEPWRPGRVTLAFRRLADRLGVTGVRLHDLRHFAATQLLAAGVPVKTVSARLGHANPTTTLNVYAHHLESADEDAAVVMGGLLDGPQAGGQV